MTFNQPMRFQEAAEFAERKNILPTDLRSRQIFELDQDLKQRSVFSARLMLADPLQVLKKDLELIASGDRDEHGRIRSIPEAKARLRESLIRSGYVPKHEDGSLLNHLSDARRQLIIETSVLDTLGAGRWKAGMDPDSLAINPAWELVRMVQSRVPRNWAQRWHDAAEAVGWEGVVRPELANGRMIALKTSPIWQALGDGDGPDGKGHYKDTLGNPWAPFAYNSGMNLRDVRRRECLELGLIQKGQKLQPVEGPKLNENTQANVSRFDASLQKALADDPALFLDNGVLKIRTAKSEKQIEKKPEAKPNWLQLLLGNVEKDEAIDPEKVKRLVDVFTWLLKKVVGGSSKKGGKA